MTQNSLTDSEVLRCNRRILKEGNLEVGLRVWDLITNLGVVSFLDREANISKLKKEIRDMEAAKGKKEVYSSLLQ